MLSAGGLDFGVGRLDFHDLKLFGAFQALNFEFVLSVFAPLRFEPILLAKLERAETHQVGESFVGAAFVRGFVAAVEVEFFGVGHGAGLGIEERFLKAQGAAAQPLMGGQAMDEVMLSGGVIVST